MRLILRALPALLTIIALSVSAKAQEDTSRQNNSQEIGISGTNRELDLIDLFKSIGKGAIIYRQEGDTGQRRKAHISIVPAAGYSLQTSFAALVAANASFYVGKNSNVSLVNTNITYTAQKQIILPVISEVWTNNNRFVFTTDWRYLKYPSLTFGIGSRTTLEGGYTLDYSAIRLHQMAYVKVLKDFYIGAGWNFDYFWNVKEVDTPDRKRTDFIRFGGKTSENANGPVVSVLYDSRRNPINPLGGALIKAEFQMHPQELGNLNSWHAFVLDARKYIRLPASSQNVLAFWTYEWFTGRSRVPYLLLPNTGGDPSSNTGRGYIQGRYRGANFAYLEGEYRFKLLSNGLLGGVVFANVESVSSSVAKEFSTLAQGYGLGLRIKLNKFSRTNIAIDYGWGAGGSKGVFVNLGEVF